MGFHESTVVRISHSGCRICLGARRYLPAETLLGFATPEFDW